MKTPAGAREFSRDVSNGTRCASRSQSPEGEFTFLGYSFGRMYSARTEKAYPGYRPSKKSIKRMVETIHALTVRTGTWQETTELVAKLNRTLRGSESGGNRHIRPNTEFQ
jgi:hypothetical protein